MSLVKIKPRPIKRTIDNLRDDRLFLIACDDTYAPKQYFNFYSIPRVQVHVIETKDGTSSAQHVLSRLLEVDHEEDDELWILLDTDHYTKASHVPSFLRALRDAENNGVEVALSKSCFEIWLLLHHLPESSVATLLNAKQVEKALDKVLNGYDKTKLKQADFPLASVAKAYKRAKRLDNSVKGGKIPNANTTRVYKLWKAILARALQSQLSQDFSPLLAAVSPIQSSVTIGSHPKAAAQHKKQK